MGNLIILFSFFFQTPEPPENQPVWESIEGDIWTYIIIFLLGLFLFKPLEAFLKWLWKKLQEIFTSLGFRFKEPYFRLLNDEHQWLKLIGFRKAGLDRPKLRQSVTPNSLGLRSISSQVYQNPCLQRSSHAEFWTIVFPI